MYVVIGASGFLGSYILKNLLEKTQDDVLATYSRARPTWGNGPKLRWQKTDVCSLDDLNALNVSMAEDAKVIYLAAYHHPDKVEENPLIAWENNVIALAQALKALDRAGCFYYSSTDSVYGEGSKDKRFLETDATRPVNLYGKHKALAEQITLTFGGNVVRFPFIIGPSLLPDRPHFFDKIKKDLLNGTPIEMFEDSYRSALDFDQCASLLISLIETYGAKAEKIVNIAGDEALSKYEVAKIIAQRFGLDESLIKPVSIEGSQQIFKAKRAATALIDNGKIKKLLGLDVIKLKF